jgi:hypothetical protein
MTKQRKKRAAPVARPAAGFFAIYNAGGVKSLGTGWRHVFAIFGRVRVSVFDWAAGDHCTIRLSGSPSAAAWDRLAPRAADPPRLSILAGCVKRAARRRADRAAERTGKPASARPARKSYEKAAIAAARSAP